MDNFLELLNSLKYLEELPKIREALESLASPNRHLQQFYSNETPFDLNEKSDEAQDTFSEKQDLFVDTIKKLVETPVKVGVNPTPSEPTGESYAKEFEELKSLVEDDAWPEAVDPDLICSEDHSDKIIRAESLISFILEESLEGKKFLDFGCGNGYVTWKSIDKKTELSVGYDIHAQGWGEHFELPAPHFLTTQWDLVVQAGPYDIVMLYDVLDHVEKEDAVTVLNKIKSVLKPGGRIYVRCHPWTSRTATHLYRQVNKAYLHLVFTELELARLGYTQSEKCQKIIHPHATYKQWFNDAQLDLVNEQPTQDRIEDFFHQTPVINERIRNNYKGVSLDADLNAGRAFPTYQLGIQHIDYLLKKV